MPELALKTDRKAAAGAAVWHDIFTLLAYFRDYKFTPFIMIALGIGAALAETVGIGLAVMFLFAILGQTDQIQESAGPLAKLYDLSKGVLGGEPTLIASVFFCLILLNAGLSYAYQVVTATTMNRVAERVRNLIHRQYVSVGYSFLQKKEHGELIHALGTESWRIADAFFSFARIGVNLCTVAVFGAGVVALSWEIGLATFACGLFFFLLLRLLSRRVRRLGAETLSANQLLAERMLVSLNGMRTLRLFAQEPFMLRVFGRASSNVRRLAVRMEWFKALIGPIGEVASLGTLIVIAAVGGQAGVDTPTIIAAVLLLFRLQPHLREAESHRMALAGMTASIRSVIEMLDPSDKPWPSNGEQNFGGLRSGIRFDQVTFYHDPARRPALDHVAFTLPSGKTTLLSGPSGSGKTTIVNLLLRLYEPNSGRILVDGTALNEFSRESWLERIAIAGQDVEMIEGTVIQNIRLGNHDAPMEEVQRICEMVEILKEIQDLPEGFDSRIGAAGLSLSGGQRQRLGLARALLRNPEILILDEAMSALEPQREVRIRQRIATMMRDKTIIVVSHRDNAEAGADAVVAIEGGRNRPEAAA